jgi:hypothetical protein
MRELMQLAIKLGIRAGFTRSKRVRMGGILILLCSAALAGCNFPRGGTPTPSGPELVLTYAAQTIQVQLTLAAVGGVTTFTPNPPGFTPAITTPTATLPITTPAPTSLTPSAGACDRGSFEEDITYPDNSLVQPGAEFVKTWRLKNTGTCSWDAGYAIVFDRGDALSSPPSASLTNASVPSGQTVDVSLTLKAPTDPGTYQGFWKLRNPAGQIFGLGENADKDFWVKIKVGTGQSYTYDFLVHAPDASWVSSGDGNEVPLAFGGADDDSNGVAKLQEDIILENGKQAGMTLVIAPRQTEDGNVSGTFPEYTIQQGDHFKAKLGFMEHCGSGQVVFQLWYREGGNLVLLKEWPKVCDGHLELVEVDLSSLEGKKVQFVLAVLADGSPEDDLTIWGSPRIEP